MARLKEIYKKDVAPSLMKKFEYKNVNQVPKLKKIVLSSMSRDAIQNSKVATAIADELTQIAGQKAVVAKAKKSVATFKLREGMPVGAFVTLRGDQMYEFLDRLVSISLPRVRDFRGIDAKKFDGKGNYAFGLKEQIIFPEINYDKIDKVRGLGIVIETTATNNEEGRELLSQLGMPFKK